MIVRVVGKDLLYSPANLILLLVFDEGHCSQSLAAAQAEINVMVGIMEGTQPRADPTEPGVEHPLRYVYQTVMDRVNKVCFVRLIFLLIRVDI